VKKKVTIAGYARQGRKSRLERRLGIAKAAAECDLHLMSTATNGNGCAFAVNAIE
jgi:hypothetical protein